MFIQHSLSIIHAGISIVMAFLTLHVILPVQGNPPSGNPVEDFFKTWTSYLAYGVEAAAGLIIAIAALQAAIRGFMLFFRKSQSEIKPTHPSTEDVRLRLGRWLALALEFELGADILRTAIAPTWADIEQLAAIAAIRTALNYFLQREIDRAAQRQDYTPVQSENNGAAASQNNANNRIASDRSAQKQEITDVPH